MGTTKTIAVLLIAVSLTLSACSPTASPTNTPATTSAPTHQASTPPTPTLAATSTPLPTPTSGIPLGEIGGLHYVFWDFGQSNFKSLYTYITIYNEPDNNDGLYFQMYQGTINNVGFYFGLQTRLWNPDTGVTAKGLIFSRWETRDLSNVRTLQGGWAQSAGYEGDFVGIRKLYPWTIGSYQLKIAYTESDTLGDWYGVWITNSNNSTDYLGSMRFPLVEQNKAGIANGGITWTELYSKAVPLTPIPNWHVSIDGIYATEQRVVPKSAMSDYSNIDHTDIFYDSSTERIHFIVGPSVIRQHPKGQLY